MKTISLDGGLRHRLLPPRQRRAASASRLRAASPGFAALWREWRRRARSRAELARLDDRMLRDIGVTRVEVLHEIGKPFWRK
jgi:uncharacterized protein YjiS (DUF1127 family)